MRTDTTIAAVQPFILHVPVTGAMIQDSTHTVTHWGVVGVRITTASGIEGYGFTGTHAHLASDRLITDCISTVYAPLLDGEDASDVQRLWHKLYGFPAMQWIGRMGISHLALSAVDTALWDIKAKAAEQPLWKFLGGATAEKLEAYNTDGGWLSLTPQAVADGCKRLIEVEGFRGVKIKIGSSSPRDDLKRIETVRRAIGLDVFFAVDCNGRWDLPTMLSIAPHLDQFAVRWVEEPIFYDDVPGHQRLSAAMSTPIALGEQLYALDHFRDFIAAGAVHYVQPDVTRLAGITEWMRAADLSYAYRLPVVAHVGDMAQVHVHLAYAHPACSQLEYIPWIKDCFSEPIRVVDGYYQRPEQPGAGTTLTAGAMERFGQPL